MGFIARILWFVVGIIVAALLFRFFFLLLGANPVNSFVNMIYAFTQPLVAPFRGIFGSTVAVSGEHLFEWATVVAMVVYSVIAMLIEHLLVPPTRTVL